MNVPLCPYCGGKVKLRRGLPNMGNSNTKFGFLLCLECGKQTNKKYQGKNESQLEFRERVLDEWRKLK